MLWDDLVGKVLAIQSWKPEFWPLAPPTQEKPGAPIVKALGWADPPMAGQSRWIHRPSLKNVRWKVIKEYTRPQLWFPCVHASGTCTHMHVLHMYTRRIYFQGYQQLNVSIIFYITLKCWVSNIDVFKRSQAWWYTLVILSLRRLQQGDCKFETKNLSQKQNPKKPQKTKNENKMLSKFKCYFGLFYYYFCTRFEFPRVFRMPSTAQFGLANPKCSGTRKPRTVVQTRDTLLTAGFVASWGFTSLSRPCPHTFTAPPTHHCTRQPWQPITPAGNGSHVSCARTVSCG